jgi:putative hydrolase of HD superfamily
MLKRTPRGGFQFLGSGAESVAEHIFEPLASDMHSADWEKNIDVDRLIKMCLFHDLPEARTGDLNYVNKKYVEANEKRAVEDLAQTLPFGHEIKELIQEFSEGVTEEARLARDADQLEFIFALKEYKDLGNKYADEWLEFSLKRLQTGAARELAKTILKPIHRCGGSATRRLVGERRQAMTGFDTLVP